MRNLTAALKKIPYPQRLRLALQLRGLPRLSRADKLAFRVLASEMVSSDTDMLIRSQILEGLARITPLRPHTSGPWSRNPRQGLKEAQEFFADKNLDPLWFSKSNTGLVRQLWTAVNQAVRSWGKGGEGVTSADDILQYAMAGIGRSGQLLSGGPFFFVWAYKAPPGVQQEILNGGLTPSGVAGMLAKYLRSHKVQNEFTQGDRNKVPTVNEEGESILDTFSAPDVEVPFTHFMLWLLKTNTPEAQRAEALLRRAAGNITLAHKLIDAFVEGRDPGSLSAFAKKELGGSGRGGSVRAVLEQFIPKAQKLIRADQELYSLYKRSQGRFMVQARRKKNFR